MTVTPSRVLLLSPPPETDPAVYHDPFTATLCFAMARRRDPSLRGAIVISAALAALATVADAVNVERGCDDIPSHG